MQSPFKLFRKYQKVILAVMAVGAMIAFGVGDVVVRMVGGGRNLPGAVVVDTTAGNLTQRDVQELLIKRRTANAFMLKALLAVHPEFEKFPQFLGGREHRFGVPTPQNVVFAWLMRQEAKRLGVVVDDEQINAFIDKETSRKLSSEKFRGIIRDMQISGKELYDVLRGELLSLVAFQTTVPFAAPSPEQYWEYYQQLHTRQKIAVAPLPVKDFTEKVRDPDETAVATYFEAHKNDFEQSEKGEYKPGFRQPTRVRLHYLQLTYTMAEKKVLEGAPITDAQIEEYYETKKRIDRRLQELPAAPTGESAPLDPEFGSEEEEGQEAGSKPAGPALEAPAEGAPTERPSPPAAPTDDAPAAPENQCGPGANAADDDETDPPAEAADTTEEPARTEEALAEKPAEGEASEKTEATRQEPGEEEGDDKPSGEGEKKPIKAPPAEPKYKPLDNELRDQIRDILLHERTIALMKELSGKAAEALRDVGLNFTQARDFDLSKIKPAELPKLAERSEVEMRKIAGELGLTFGATSLVSARELTELPGIGKAQAPDSDEFAPGGALTIVDMALGGERLCTVFTAETPAGDASARDTYVFWKIQDVPSHVPTLDEPGVREQVVAAWKLNEAIPVAKKRAEELAELIRQHKGDRVSEALAAQTVTGEAGSLSVIVQESPEFSFWRESLVPQAGPRQAPVQLSNPVVVTGAGESFMEYVFNELKEGDVGTVMNDDASVCYVVKVISRRPADREAFKVAPLFSPFGPYRALAERNQQYAQAEFGRRLEKVYAVKWRETESAAPEAANVEDE